MKHSRRQFLKTSSGLFVLPLATQAKAGTSPPPRAYQGLALGDLSSDGVILWSRCNQSATLKVEWSRYDDFRYVQKCPEVDALSSHDYTAKLALKGLPPDQDIFVRAHFQSTKNGKTSERILGKFRTPSLTNALTFICMVGILVVKATHKPDIGGYRMFSEI